MNKLLRIYDKISLLRVKLPRIIDARKELSLKNNYLSIRKLTPQESAAVKSFWGGVKPNTKYLSLYNTHNTIFDPRYIPDDMYYSKIDLYFNNGVDCFALDDKNMYDLYFPHTKQPRTIIRKINGSFLDKDYHLISLDFAIEECKKERNIIIKKAICSNGGKSIVFWHTNEGTDILKDKLSASYDFIVQEIITQHPDIAKLHPTSINTIRILTLLFDDQVHILSAIIRMGANGSKVDNGHSGGVFCGIDKNGQLKDIAYTYMTGQRFERYHPTTGAVFSDCIIPNFDKCKKMIRELAPRISRVSRLTSWDLSITEDGSPTLIEVNLAYGGLFFHQITNGPVFGNMTKKIIDTVL